MKYRKRSQSKQQQLDQESHEEHVQPPSSTKNGPVTDNIKKAFSLKRVDPSQVMIIPKDVPLKTQHSTLPTVLKRERGKCNGDKTGSQQSGINLSSTWVNHKAKQQNNCERDDGEMTHKNSVVVAPNLAYNKVARLMENGQQNRWNRPPSNVRQVSGDHSYDYPLKFGGGYWHAGKRKSNEPSALSSTYDRIATVTNTSYTVGNKK